MKKHILFTLLICLTSLQLFGQQDLNNFIPLTAAGKIPADFSVRTSEKIKEDMKTKKEDLSNSEQKVFLDGIHYGIDEILQSGLVIYNDEISNYLTKIANKLLETKPDLLKKLRFYTVKSNVSNAFSTDQGIVFVTTGLMSQISSEAHLAFILAHEISHYIEKHVVEGFEFRTRNRGINAQILQLSQYSKDKEFEADSLGVEIYKKAGYSREFLTSTFDVLKYSYLPINEIPFPKDYFNSSICFVPEDKFTEKEYEIKVDEDYDDSKSSHPNVRKRKKRANKVADNLENWGNKQSYFGTEEFVYIRNLARFERIRSNIIDLEFGKALYTIFILEQEFPESLYLHRMKAQCWFGLTTMKNGNKINRTVMFRKDLEGEGAGMHIFIKSLRKLEMATLATRIVEDCRIKFPEDTELKELSIRTNDALFNTSRFDINDYKSISFYEAVRQSKLVDTINTVSEDGAVKKLSKYDRIKRKKHSDTLASNIDSSNYFYYILSDLVNQDGFKDAHDLVMKKLKEQDKLDDAYAKMSNSERRKYKQNLAIKENQVDLSTFILVEPAVISYKKGRVDHSGSSKMEDRVIDGFEYVSAKLNLEMTTIGKTNLDQLGTDGFNQKSFFTALLIQIANAEGEDVFPVDYSRIRALKGELSSDKLVFSVVEHSFRPKFNPSALWLIFTGPGIFGYLPVPFIKGNQTELNLAIVDLETAQIVSSSYYYFKEPLNQYSIESKLYDIFLQKSQQDDVK